MPNIFDKSTADKMIRRVQNLTSESTPQWGQHERNRDAAPL